MLPNGSSFPEMETKMVPHPAPANMKGPKKNQSAYFHFMNSKRSEIQAQNQDASFGELTRIATDIWKNLSAEDRKVYVDMANSDRERYHNEINQFLERGIDFRAQKRVVDDLNSSATIFPTARIKKVVRLDSEVKHVSGEAFTVITKATDLFVAYLAEHSLNSSTARRKKTIDKVDVHQSIYSGPEQLDFLVPDFEKPIIVQREKKKMSSNSKKKQKDSASVGDADMKQFVVDDALQ